MSDKRSKPWPSPPSTSSSPGIGPWLALAAVVLALTCMEGFHLAFSVFLTELTKEFGWGRGEVMLSYVLYVAGYALLSPITSVLADILGSRVIVGMGGGFIVLSAVIFSRMTTIGEFYLGFLVMAVAEAAIYIPGLIAVMRRFVQLRGMAVGIAASGISLGYIVGPPLSGLALSMGWRDAYLVFGLPSGLLVILGALFLTRSTQRDDAFPVDHASHGSMLSRLSDALVVVRRVAATRAFLMFVALLAMTFTFCYVPLVHIGPHATEHGASLAFASMTISSVGVGLLVGRILLGALSDRLGAMATLRLSLSLEALAFISLTLTHWPGGILAFGFVFGLGHGGVSAVFPVLTRDLFGDVSGGAILGLVFALSSWPIGIGVYVGGVVFDAFSSYTLVFVAGALANVFAFLMVGHLRRRESATSKGGQSVAA